jgi:hypothetical protein
MQKDTQGMFAEFSPRVERLDERSVEMVFDAKRAPDQEQEFTDLP